jgi:cell division septation protein DedD
MSRGAASVLAAVVLLCQPVAPLPGGSAGVVAQASGLDGVESHLAAARFSDARAALERWWEGEAHAPRDQRQHALWLRARLTIDPAMAELDYRRLVVEYPGGPWSDAALLRLAQGAEFRGEVSDARQYLEILVRDYPGSPHRVEARDRLRRLDTALPAAVSAPEAAAASLPASAPAPDPATAPEPESAPAADPAVETEAEPVPVPESDVAHGTEAEQAPVSARARDRADPEPPPGMDVGAGGFTVQLGAFSSEERARALSSAARAAGLEVRIVQVEGSPFFRVRMGGYASRESAERAAGLPRELGFEAVVGGDRDREIPSG